MLRKSIQTIRSLNTLPRSSLATSIAKNDHLKLGFPVNFYNNQKIPEAFKTSMTDGYISRHLGNDPAQVKSMLETLGCKSLDELMNQTVPSSIRLKKENAFEHGRNKVVGIDSQHVVLEHMKNISDSNKQSKSYIGQGYYQAILPTVILRNVLENPKWYTPYTPYQAEISQGRLEMLLNWQTMITELTGMDISNASLLDEATSAAEAMAMSFATHNQKRKMFYVSESIFPQIIDVINTRASMSDINLVIGKIEDFPWSKADEFCGVICQTPDNLGNVHDLTEFFNRLRENEVRSIVCADIMSLTICKTPGQMGADIAVGSGQRFGLPMGFGGPHPGFMACKDEFKRKMPGRIIGISKDADGDQALRMSMQTREQHIRRDKATSNVCTAQALLANMTAFYGIWHRPEGLTKIAQRLRFRTEVMRDELSKLGVKVITDKDAYFDTIAIDCQASGFSSADWLLAEFNKFDCNLRKIDNNTVGITFNETT